MGEVGSAGRSKECQELAGRVRNQILFEPKSHNQPSWATFVKSVAEKLGVRTSDGLEVSQCNTTGCVCGWASMLAGDKGVIRDGTPTTDVNTRDGWKTGYSIDYVKTPDGEVTQISSRGGELLCLTRDERRWLFSQDRKRLEVLHALMEIEADEPISCKSRFTTAEARVLERPTKKNRRIVYYRQNGDQREEVIIPAEKVNQMITAGAQDME